MTPYSYRSLGGLDEKAYVQACLDDLEDVIQTMTSGPIAAMIMEPIQGVGGFITVQTGFGRTGTHWWGHQHAGITPDIMTMAKGIANGMPLSAVATTEEIAASAVGKGLTLSTFGGNPVCCAASIGTLKEMKREYGPERSAAIGLLLQTGLHKLQDKYPLIGEVRGRGLMQGIELVADRETKTPGAAQANAILNVSRKLGLLIGKGGLHGNALRIAPPLIATEENVAEALEKLDHAFARVQEMSFGD